MGPTTNLRTMQYGEFGLPTKMTTTTTNWKIRYDADGNRVVRRPVVSGTLESVAGEFITLGQLVTKKPTGIEYQIRVGGQPVALISRVKNGTTWSSSVRYVHTDEKGTPAAITDGSGNMVDATKI